MQWGVLLAAHYEQSRIIAALQQMAVDHFRPVQEVSRKVRGRHQSVFVPVLGTYILTQITEQWREVNTLKGSMGWLMTVSDNPAQVLDSEMAYLRALCPNGVISRANKAALGFRYGDRVTPNSGPLANHVGRYDSIARKGDSAFFMLFGREQRVLFQRGQLVAA